MTKLKWYQRINPLFWLEQYVARVVYTILMNKTRNITDDIISDRNIQNKTTIVVCSDNKNENIKNKKDELK